MHISIHISDWNKSIPIRHLMIKKELHCYIKRFSTISFYTCQHDQNFLSIDKTFLYKESFSFIPNAFKLERKTMGPFIKIFALNKKGASLFYR